jgi:hypothetical protein
MPHDWLAISGIVSAFSSLVLAGFGAVQIRVARSDRLSRETETAQEKRDRQLAAVASLKAEQRRIMYLAMIWNELDLLVAAKNGDLHPDDLTPLDWGMIVQLLGQAGSAASYVASASYGCLQEAVLHARRLKWAGDLWRQKKSQHRAQNLTFEQQNADFVQSWERDSGLLAGIIRHQLIACAEGLENAIRCAPYGSDEVEIPFHLLSMKSEVVRGLQEAQKQVRAASVAEGLPRDSRRDAAPSE